MVPRCPVQVKSSPFWFFLKLQSGDNATVIDGHHLHKCVSPVELAAQRVLDFASAFETVKKTPKRFEIEKDRQNMLKKLAIWGKIN